MKNFFFFLALLLIALKVKAQDSNWSVNAADYQYNMTFTAFLSINGTTLSSSEDKVAAFVNGEVRGVANVVYVSAYNKYVAYLSVYANTNGETISFKMYDSDSDAIVASAETYNFSIDATVGGVFQSFSIANPALSNDAVLNSFSFKGITTVSETILNNRIDIVLPFGTDSTNLIAEYSISAGATFFVDFINQISGETSQNFTNAVSYKLMSENEATLIDYDVYVALEISNTDPPQLILSSDVNAFVKQAPVVINVQTNVAISGFTTEDILLSNAVVAAMNKVDELNYILQIIPIQQGLFSIEIPGNSVFNNENEGNAASNKLNYTYDLIHPYVLSIKRENPTDEITNSETLEFTVIFNEAVENVTSSVFDVISGASINLTKETAAKYIVTLTNIKNYTGIVSLNIKATNTIQDIAGNLLMNAVINVNQN
ncbi:MAG: hypothetical protein ACI93N_001930 [Flavobacteriaceae bacterium]|jgi:hypothetical protein